MKPDQERVRNLLTDTVTLLCKNGLQYKKELRVQGLLGITLDDTDVFVVHINERFSNLLGATISCVSDDGVDDADVKFTSSDDAAAAVPRETRKRGGARWSPAPPAELQTVVPQRPLKRRMLMNSTLSSPRRQASPFRRFDDVAAAVTEPPDQQDDAATWLDSRVPTVAVKMESDSDVILLDEADHKPPGGPTDYGPLPSLADVQAADGRLDELLDDGGGQSGQTIDPGGGGDDDDAAADDDDTLFGSHLTDGLTPKLAAEIGRELGREMGGSEADRPGPFVTGIAGHGGPPPPLPDSAAWEARVGTNRAADAWDPSAAADHHSQVSDPRSQTTHHHGSQHGFNQAYVVATVALWYCYSTWHLF